MTASEPREAATHPIPPIPTRSAALGGTEGLERATGRTRSLDQFGHFVPVCLGCGVTVEHHAQWQVYDPTTQRTEWPYCRDCYDLHPSTAPASGA